MLCALARCGYAQKFPVHNPDTLLHVTIDSAINIVGHRLTSETFINEILRDSSFFDAFRNMKKYSFVAENRFNIYKKNNGIDGTSYRKIKRSATAANKVQYLARKDSGNLYKKDGKYQLYTLEMFDYIFMNAYQSAFSETRSTKNIKGNDNESYRDKLKKLLFTPGRPVPGIPFIGNKTEIFTANMRQYYDYTYHKGTYHDSIPVYHFKVTEKKDLSNWTKGGIMIKELTTIFDQRSMQILGRHVVMRYSNMLFDFDVQMTIELGYFGKDETLLPTFISYRGNWDVPMKKPERSSFVITQTGYR